MGIATAQTPPQVPDDPNKVQGRPPSELGDRSSFEAPRRVPSATSSLTPLDLLNGIITPSDVHYERHHAGVPLIDPKRYTLTLHGMVDRQTVFTLDDLKRFPSMSRIMFLECSGNSGSGWTKGRQRAPRKPCTADQHQRLTGVSGLDAHERSRGAARREVGTGRGRRRGGSLAQRAHRQILDDAFIAYGQNGEALRPEQGYPARLMLPGWEGNINVQVAATGSSSATSHSRHARRRRSTPIRCLMGRLASSRSPWKRSRRSRGRRRGSG